MTDRLSSGFTAALVAAVCCFSTLSTAETALAADSPMPPIRPMRMMGLPADIAAILLSGQEGGDLPIAVLAAPTENEDGSVSVPLSIEIDAGVLFDFATDAAEDIAAPLDDEVKPERLEIFAYALGADGSSIQDSLLQAYDIDSHRLSPERRGLRYLAELKLSNPPGQIRALVRLQHSDALAVRSIDIEAPTPDQARLSVPRVSGDGDWIRLPRILPTGQLPPTPELFLTEIPAARAVIVRGEPLSFAMDALGLDTVGSQLTVELTASDGRLSGQASAELTGYAAPDARGMRRLEASAETSNIPLGSFDLRAVLPVGETVQKSPSLPVLVIDAAQALQPAPDTQSRGEAWPWLIARLTAPGAPQAAGKATRRNAVNDDAMAKALDEVFGHLASGSDVAARGRHVRLATEVADKYGSLGLKALAKTEFDRAKSLAGLRSAQGAGQEPANPAAFSDAVLPLAALNFDLYREARRLGRTLISTHARFMTLRLVELYLKVSPNKAAAQTTAATLLVSLGGELQLADMIYFSERMFRKALSMDERQTTALLALGMNYQLIGDVKRARDTFESLLALQSDHGEAHLRLARLELIDGRWRNACKLLEKAIASSGPSWVRSVAHQELARIEIDRGELASARARLNNAIKQFPDETRLRVLLAFANEASQDIEGAKANLVHTAADDWPKRPSARRRFGSWSRESFVLNDRRLQEKVEGAQPVFERRWQAIENSRPQGSRQ